MRMYEILKLNDILFIFNNIRSLSKVGSNFCDRKRHILCAYFEGQVKVIFYISKFILNQSQIEEVSLVLAEKLSLG